MRNVHILLRLTLLLLAGVGAQTARGQSITLGAASVAAYQPFTATVNFAAPHCISPNFPLIAQTSYRSGEYSVVLSHVKSGSCRQSYDLVIPGLPIDAVRLRISVSRSPEVAGAPAVIAESIVRPVDVRLPDGAGALSRMYTARVESDGVFDPFSAPTGSGVGPVVLWPFAAEPLTGAKWLVETVEHSEGDAYTFKYFKTAGPVAPAGLTTLYSIQYPAPLRGLFYTTDAALAEELARAWRRSVSNVGLVGRLEQGSCPVGMSPVYQAFFALGDIAHRYTQSSGTYRALIANGYAGEGPKWCAPER